MALVKFYQCTQAQYNALQTKIEGALYFTTDTKRIYKGETLYGGSFEYCASTLPASGSVGTLYYQGSTGKTFEWNGEDYVEKYLPVASGEITNASTVNTIPTSKAVYDLVNSEATQRAADDQVLSGAINTINGSDTTAGSFAKAVKDAKDALSGAIDGEATQRAADDQVLSGAILTLNGDNQTAGSVAKAVKDAKDAVEAIIGGTYTSENTVAAAISAEATARGNDDQYLSGQIGAEVTRATGAEATITGLIGTGFDSTNTVAAAISAEATARENDDQYLSGQIDAEVTRATNKENALSGAIGEGFDSTNTVKAAIEAIEAAAISVSGAANTAIEVTESGINKTIGLKINANDKILSQTSDGLSATVSLVAAGTLVDATNNAAEYYLADKDGNKLGATINIPKDQLLSDVAFVEGSGSADDKLRFTFAVPSGSKVVDVDLSGLFNEYEEGNGITLEASATGIKIAGKIDNASESFLTVGADGFKLSGVQTAIDTGDQAISGAIGSGFTSGATVKTYIDNAAAALSTAIGTDSESGAFNEDLTVVGYINDKVDTLASSTTASLNGKLDNVTATSGEIIIADGEGKVESSGKAIGGATMAATPTANTVATEIAVSAFVDEKIEDALSASLVWNTLS